MTTTVPDRRAVRRQATVDELVDVAVDVMAEHGAAGLSLGEVARRMGMRPPSLYVYVDSKNAVYDLVFAQGWRAVLEIVDTLPEPGPTTDVTAYLTHSAETYLRWSVEHPVHAALMLRTPLRRSHNVHWQAVEVSKDSHAALKGHRPAVLWFTGLSGAGKSTIANLVEKRLHAEGIHTYLLDGDNVRHGLNKDLGFSEADRHENIRRIAEVSRLMVDAGLVVLTSFISPFRAERAMARALLEEGEFVEVHVDTPLDVAEQRDTKGLYAKARRGELKDFTGIDSPYEAPDSPEIRVDTTSMTPEEAAEQVVAHLRAHGVLR